jgi:hypothetical protein
LTGFGGNDTISGCNGIDTAFGGPLNDAIDGGEGDDILWGNFGSDTITGGSGADFIDGDNPFPDPPPFDPGPNNDNCTGGSGSDQISNCETTGERHARQVAKHPQQAGSTNRTSSSGFAGRTLRGPPQRSPVY